MKDRKQTAEENNLSVLKAVDPGDIQDGDELDDVWSIPSPDADDKAKPTGLQDDDNHDVGEVAKDGDSHSTEGEGGHPDVAEKGEDGTHVRMDLERNL